MFFLTCTGDETSHFLCDSATPSAPFGITMLSCDGSSITLAWKSPRHCGGSKINAYYIDKRDADTLVWKEVNQEAVTERICTVSGVRRSSPTCRLSARVLVECNVAPLCLQVDNLTEGIFYEFKVQAANMAGVGVPSAPSAPMKCEAWTMEEPGRRTMLAAVCDWTR